MDRKLRRTFDVDLELIRAVLRRWDPIGVLPEEADSDCRDEYDDYAPQLLALIYARAPVSNVTDRLEHIRTSTIGLPPNREADERTAVELMHLRESERVASELDGPGSRSLSPNTIEMTSKEWRELGFFYNRDDVAKQWQMIGTRRGLLRFAELAEQYASNPALNAPSEHEHFGPHMYLEIMTWHKPGIDDHAIYGTQADIKRLASLIREAIDRAAVGDVVVLGEEFTPDVRYNISLSVQEDSFDPASADPQLAAG